MRIIRAIDPCCIDELGTDELRSTFTSRDLFKLGSVEMAYWEVDRTLIGGVVPLSETLALPDGSFFSSESILSRREMGLINLGGEGSVSVDGKTFEFGSRDGLYLGRGAVEISFSSKDPSNPAKFYVLCYPAHKNYPTTFIEGSTVEAS